MIARCSDLRCARSLIGPTPDIETEDFKGSKIAILAENGFEQEELVVPRKALDQAGAKSKSFLPRTIKFTPDFA